MNCGGLLFAMRRNSFLERAVPTEPTSPPNYAAALNEGQKEFFQKNDQEAQQDERTKERQAKNDNRVRSTFLSWRRFKARGVHSL